MATGLSQQAQEQRNAIVLQQIDSGTPVQTLAEYYGVTRVTIWRWKNAALANVMPDPDDRQAWREELLAMLTERLHDNPSNRDLVALADRISKIVGADHSAKVDEARVRIEAEKVRLIADSITTALDRAGVAGSKRAEVLSTLVSEVRRLEAGQVSSGTG